LTEKQKTKRFPLLKCPFQHLKTLDNILKSYLTNIQTSKKDQLALDGAS